MPDVPAVVAAAPSPNGTAPALLTLAGLAAAFGAASCCALPMVLSSLGLGSVWPCGLVLHQEHCAWLFGLALLVGPHRTVLLAAAAAGLVGGAFLLWRQRRGTAAACEPGAACSPNLATRRVTTVGLAFGCALLTLTYLYA